MKFWVALMLLAMASLTNGMNYGRFKTAIANEPRNACTCGVANPSRVLGGNEVSPPNKYPWMVGIKFEHSRTYFCGGSIINNRYILSAAHCFWNRILYYNGKLVVGIADHDMTSTDDDVTGVTRLVRVDVIFHPDYYTDQVNDIALLRMRETLDFSKHKEIRPVCLPKDASEDYTGSKGIVSGWGRLNVTAPQPPVLMETLLTIQSPFCRLPPGELLYIPQMLCAMDASGQKSACKGDSGGPFTVEEEGIYTQVGVGALSLCGGTIYPVIFTRVTRFLPWILENTADAVYC